MVLTLGPAAYSFAPASLDEALSTPVDDPYYPAKGDPNIDVLSYDLDLTWRPRHGLTGVAELEVRSVVDQSSLQLDLSRELDVSRVRLDDVSIGHSHTDHILTLTTGPLLADNRHTLVITYKGMPRPVKAPTKRSDFSTVGWSNRSNGGMWTMQEPFGAFTYYPVNDHPSDKAYYDVRLDVPGDMVGVSGGKMLSRRHVDGRTITRFELSDPAASYLVTVAIGDYKLVRDRGPHDLRLSYWVPRGNTESLKFLRQSPNLLRWLEDRLGRYPFDRAGAVVVPSLSAMETQELVTMGASTLQNRKRAIGVLLHEYAHQWYGDTVTPNNWPDLWMNEGFAMYIQFEYEISRGWYRRLALKRFLASLDQQLRRQEGPPGEYFKDNFASTVVYYSGALMLYRLRAKLGDKVFASALRAWPHARENVSTDRVDYIDWLSTRTGRDLAPFINDWLTARRSPAKLVVGALGDARLRALEAKIPQPTTHSTS